MSVLDLAGGATLVCCWSFMPRASDLGGFDQKKWPLRRARRAQPSTDGARGSSTSRTGAA